jgi:hypothetical protein
MNEYQNNGPKPFKFTHLFTFVGIVIAAIFVLYVIKCILEESGLTVNKLERYFKRSEPKLMNQQAGESKPEAHAREVTKIIFGKDFEKIRPDILKNDITGHNLELDLYNSELNLGIEVSGIQHYKFVPFFHKNYEHFLNQKYRDWIKKTLCEKNGIKLIEVPYTVKLKDMETFIRLEARKLGFDV